MKILLVLAIIILVVVLGFALWTREIQPDRQDVNNQQQEEEQKQPENEEPEVITSDVDTSNWKTYRNAEYGFEVKYPREYLDKVKYNIWEASNDKIALLLNWGINKGQETIFAISVYPKHNKEELINSNQLKISNEQVSLPKVKVEIVKFPSFKSFMVESENYIYIIQSSFSEDYYNEYSEYRDFYAMLLTFKLF